MPSTVAWATNIRSMDIQQQFTAPLPVKRTHGKRINLEVY